jgi:hypothetical protein
LCLGRPLTYKSQDTSGSLNATNSLNGRVVQYPLIKLMVNIFIECKTTGYPSFPLRHLDPFHGLRVAFQTRCLSLHHQSPPCTLWVNPFFLCRRKKGFVDPFLVIESSLPDADLFTLVASIVNTPTKKAFIYTARSSRYYHMFSTLCHCCCV